MFEYKVYLAVKAISVSAVYFSTCEIQLSENLLPFSTASNMDSIGTFEMAIALGKVRKL